MLGMQGALQLSQEPLHALCGRTSHARRDAAQPAEARRASREVPAALHTHALVNGQLCRAACGESASPRLATAVLSSTVSAGWRMMSRWAEGWRASAGELTK